MPSGLVGANPESDNHERQIHKEEKDKETHRHEDIYPQRTDGNGDERDPHNPGCPTRPYLMRADTGICQPVSAGDIREAKEAGELADQENALIYQGR